MLQVQPWSVDEKRICGHAKTLLAFPETPHKKGSLLSSICEDVIKSANFGAESLN